MHKTFIIFTILCFIWLSDASAQNQNKNEKQPKETPVSADKKTNERPEKSAKPEILTEPFEKADVKNMASQCVTIETTEGSIVLEFFPESAPESVRNFLNLSAGGHLNTTTFSRVVPDFIIQGGDLGTSEKWSNELSKRASKILIDEPNQIKHERGILSMARTDEPNSASTHFFILLREAPSLDGKFAAFGRVTKGMDIVEKINKMPVENEKPKSPVKINKTLVGQCAATPN